MECCRAGWESNRMSVILLDRALLCSFFPTYMFHAALSRSPDSFDDHFPPRACPKVPKKNYPPFNRTSRQSTPMSSPPRWEELRSPRRNLCSRLLRKDSDTSPLLQLDVR